MYASKNIIISYIIYHHYYILVGVDIHRDSEAVLPSKEKKEHLIEQFYLCVYLFYWPSE